MVCMPSNNIHSVTQIHRDRDSYDLLCLFIEWNKTDLQDGATYFEPKSHLEKNCQPNNGIFLESRPGSAILCNTFARHSGNKSNETPRVASWFRFSPYKGPSWYGNKNFLYQKYYLN